jgi:DNA-binding LacI/PurR family transcriptional regulator
VTFALAPRPVGGMAGPERQEAATYRVSRSRLLGFAAVVEAAGLSWAEVPVYECTRSAPEEGRVAAEALLSRKPRPTAILAFSDQLAFGAMGAARSMRLSVPRELSVAGFDDVPEAARSVPPLTTVRQPHVEKGLRAGRMLLAQLRGEESPGSEVLPTRLLLRSSTAPVKTRR